MIKIIEKEPYKNFDNWNNRECLMYPTMMIKDGKEHFYHVPDGVLEVQIAGSGDPFVHFHLYFLNLYPAV